MALYKRRFNDKIPVYTLLNSRSNISLELSPVKCMNACICSHLLPACGNNPTFKNKVCSLQNRHDEMTLTRCCK